MGAKYKKVAEAVMHDLSVMELEDLADLISDVLAVKKHRDYSPEDDDDEFDDWLEDDDEAPPVTSKKVMPRYRNPMDLSQTWSGRGMKPRWLVDQMAQGRALEEFLIKFDADGRSIVKPSKE